MNGLIFDIRRFSTNDGPGIRTTVFFKGCPLSCVWCHNPESQEFEIERYTKNIRLDDKSFEIEQKVGKWYSVDEVMTEILKDKLFYDQSGGGVTFSGGEPLMQYEFLKILLVKCREHGIHTAVDTSGFASQHILNKIAALVDLFLYDLKIVNNDAHFHYTGKPNEPILGNLKRLISSGKKIILRFPVIPGITLTTENISELTEFLKPLLPQVDTISLLPYHPLARNKYNKLNSSEKFGEFPEVPAESLASLENLLSEMGMKVSVGF